VKSSVVGDAGRVERELKLARGPQEGAFGDQIGGERTGERVLDQRAERGEIRHPQFGRGGELLALEVDFGAAGELRGGDLGPDVLDPQLLRRGLGDRQRQADALAHEARELVRQESRVRPHAAVEMHARLRCERDLEAGLGARQALGVELKGAGPAVERAGA
jgi:hypothetical protein